MEPSGRLWLIFAAAILLAAGAASVWMVSVEPSAAPTPVAAVVAPPEPKPAPPPASKVAAVAEKPAPRIPEPTPIAAAPVVVDSSEQTYPLNTWRIGQTIGGWIDAPALGDNPLDDQAILELSGWAGDSEVGWRARLVAIAVCGTVVATVRADQPRPEVARAAHPNLGRSGWRAKIAVAHLPRCAQPRVQAVAQIGDGRSALPLGGERSLRLAAAGGPHPVLLSPPSPALPPDAEPELRAIRLSGNTNVRRCAGLQCEIRGRLSGGSHRAIIGDETPEWLLVSVPANNLTGWISKQVLARR
ncbi:MAG: hypothetical protein GC202_08085 [Alphaproteobacteria bacterium]|nr:hypothetical protein [Alphaproteobacteria bacterium]